MKKIILLALILTTFPINADINTKVNSWFSNMDYVNVTPNGSYQSQGARYVTGGGISVRAPITQPFNNLVNVQTPSFSAGCGGIDMYTGGFSFIDADQFVENLRAIGQNAQALAFMLAIQIVSPQLSGVMEEIQSWAEKINSLNINSCEMAMGIMGGAAEAMGMENGNCMMRRMNNFGEDYTQAKVSCGTGGELRTTEASGTDGPNETDFIKGNLTWYVLMQDPFFQGDLVFAELMMNLIGTVIITDAGPNADSPNSVVYITPSVEGDIEKERFRNIVNALLEGGNSNPMQLRRCAGAATNDPDGCLAVTGLQNVPVNWTGMRTTVSTLLADISTRVTSDSALTNMQVGLISSTRLPVYRFISAASASNLGMPITQELNEFSDLISNDIVLSSLQSILERTESQASNLENNMSDSERMKEWRKNISSVIEGINKLKAKNTSTAKDKVEMMQRIRNYEKQVVERLGSSLMAKVTWNR
ncbi:MAG: conjugal transfer protein TraH [Methylococcales bacterium]